MKHVLFTFILAALLITLSSPSYAQYQVGKNTGGILIGVGGGGLDGSGAIPISVEYNFLNFEKNIQAGLFASYAHTSDDAAWGKWAYTNIVIAAQGNWHFYPGEKFDPFIGASLGYNIASASWTWNATYANAGYPSPSVTAGGFFYSGQAGFNYWFTPKMAGQLRVGYYPYVAAGLTLAM